MRSGHRALDVEGLVNARDLGGLPLIAGGTTPHGVFFRSENLEAITPKGWDGLRAAGIRTVVDLRTPGERDLDRCVRPDWLVTSHVDHDAVDNEEFWRGYRDNGLISTALYFLPHLAAMPERTGAVLTALAEADEGGVLFHCMSGRDRTGIVSMVLLSLAGVEPEAIVEDYLETVRLGDARAAATGRANEEVLIENLLAGYGTTTEQAFRDALGGLDVEALLTAAGVGVGTRRVLQTWRGRLPFQGGTCLDEP